MSYRVSTQQSVFLSLIFRLVLSLFRLLLSNLPLTYAEDKREEDKTPEEKELEEQAKYDAEAMVYLSYALYPLIVCYAIYSLIYEEHKSWYSFILGVLTGCVYTFG